MKRKILIAAGVLLALIVVVIVALSIVVKTYLKSENLKPIIIPMAEEFTGRDVELDRIDVSLFKGIVLQDLSVKEDGRDFVRVKEFVLAYDLLPLLRKQLVIRKIVLVSPSVRIIRLSDGKYNFSDILERVGKKEEPSGKKTEGGGLPVSLITERILIEDADVEFIDRMKELPDVKALADADFKLALEKTIRAEGKLDIKELDAELKGVKTKSKGKLDIKKDLLEADIETSVDGETINLKATAKDYANAPDVTFTVKAGKLDVEKLMALIGKLGGGKPAEKASAQEAAEGKPMDIKAAGTVDIKSAKYKEFDITDIHLAADSRIKLGSSATGNVDIKELKANVNGMGVSAGGAVKLEKESIKASLRTALDLPGSFQYKEYNAQGLRLDASPDITYLFNEQKVKAHAPVKELSAASLSTKEASLSGVKFSGIADVAYGIKSEALSATVKMDDLKANFKGADISAKGTVSYDGDTLSAALKEAKAAAETFAHEDYAIKGLRLDAATDVKIGLRKKTASGTVELKELKANVNGVDMGAKGKISATEKQISAQLTATIDKDNVMLTATATDYTEAPVINFDAYSKKLDLDRLMALGGPEKEKGSPQQPAKKKTDEKPLKITATGKVKIDEADYKEYAIKNIQASIKYADDVMTVDPFSMALEGGKAMAVDGNLAGNVSFKYPRGSADAADVMKKTMSGKGSSKFKKIQINDVKVADAIARLTSLEELKNPTFTDSAFNYLIKEQKVNLDGYMNSERIKFTTQGFVGLDKAINMAADLWLDNVLTRRLIVTSVIRGKDGSSTMPLIIKGTTDDPKVSVNAEKVIKKEMDRGIQKLFEKVLPQEQQEPQPAAPQEQPPAQQQPPAQEQPAQEPIKELFKGIFGK